MQPTLAELKATYEKMRDDEIITLIEDGGLRPGALKLLQDLVKKRKIKIEAIKKDSEETHDMHTNASKGQRLANYVIDSVCVWISCLFAGVIVGIILYTFFDEQKVDAIYDGSAYDHYFTLLGFVVMVLYYFSLEKINGRTIAKYITKTRVISTDGKKLSGGQAFGRTLCRFIPFDALSFLLGENGWHDSIPKTRVIQYESTNHEKQLEKLVRMKEKGLINEKEFSTQKKKILQSI